MSQYTTAQFKNTSASINSSNSFSSLDFKLLKTIFGFAKKNQMSLHYRKRNSLDFMYVSMAKSYFEQKNKGFALFLKKFITRRKMLKAPKKEKKNKENEQLLSFRNINHHNLNNYCNRYFNHKKHCSFLDKITQTTRIQSCWRSFILRKKFFTQIRIALNRTALISVIKIQSFIRKQLTIKHVKTFCVLNAIIKKRTSSEEKINNIIERFYNVNAFKSSYLLDELIEYREKSILKIQSYYRMRLTHKKIDTLLQKIKSHYTLTYPFFAKAVQLKVYILLTSTFRFITKTYDFTMDPILNTFILFINYNDFEPNKYKCQLIVDSEVTCDGRFPHIELNDGKFYNLINFTKNGIIYSNESEVDEYNNKKYDECESGSDFEVLTNKSFCNGKNEKSNESSYEELRTNLESNLYTCQMSFIQATSLNDLVNFD